MMIWGPNGGSVTWLGVKEFALHRERISQLLLYSALHLLGHPQGKWCVRIHISICPRYAK